LRSRVNNFEQQHVFQNAFPLNWLVFSGMRIAEFFQENWHYDSGCHTAPVSVEGMKIEMGKENGERKAAARRGWGQDFTFGRWISLWLEAGKGGMVRAFAV
jgi:hypothetical protein